MRAKELIGVAGVFAGVVALAAAQGGELSYGRDIEPIFLAECGDCHGAENPKKGLDLSKGNGLANLVDRQSQEVATLTLVKAGDPASSYLWHKVTHTASEGKGMPRTLFGSKKLAPEQLALIERWIKEGAKP